MIKIFKSKDTEWIKEDIDVKPDVMTVWLKYEIKDDDYKERYFQVTVRTKQMYLEKEQLDKIVSHINRKHKGLHFVKLRIADEQLDLIFRG